MQLDIINLDDKRVMSLDYILETCNSQTSGHSTITEPDKEKYEYLATSAEMLYRMGFIKIYHSSPNEIDARLTTEGKVFIQNDSFEKQKERKRKELEIEEEKLNHSRTQHKVNENAIRAAKREPWLIAWSIASTLAAILLAIFK
jgi:stress response protein YsnF